MQCIYKQLNIFLSSERMSFYINVKKDEKKLYKRPF